MNERKKIELLAPAGDFERLKAAVLYGANAVYCGGPAFSLRANAKNFDDEEMKKGIAFAHDNGVKVYVTANIFAHNDDIDGLYGYFPRLREMGADAVIISDPGVFAIARETAPDLEIHISTQANNTNYRSALFWKNLGASRIVLARELSIDEMGGIASKTADTGLELEAFIHGAMCISYSGRCLISNYLTSRDANRGDCAQPCRWNYFLTEEKRAGEYMPVFEDGRGTYLFNSKDMCNVAALGDMINAGVTGVKIEGRMKTSYYVASVVKVYRQAIDDYYRADGSFEKNIKYYMQELEKTSHRGFTTGFYYGKPDQDQQIYENSTYTRGYEFIALVTGYDEKTHIAELEQRNRFFPKDRVEALRHNGTNMELTITEILDENGNAMESACHARQKVFVKTDVPLSAFDMLRKKV